MFDSANIFHELDNAPMVIAYFITFHIFKGHAGSLFVAVAMVKRIHVLRWNTKSADLSAVQRVNVLH